MTPPTKGRDVGQREPDTRPYPSQENFKQKMYNHYKILNAIAPRLQVSIDKPEPLRPVIHITQPFCCSNCSLSCFLTEHSCHKMLVEFSTVDICFRIVPSQ